jgi:hypothetical protein
MPLKPLLIVAVSLALPGCDVRVRNGKVEDVNLFSTQLKQDWSRTYPLSAGGQVEVANLNGPITVNASASDQVEVRAEITAKAYTEAAAKDLMSKGRIEEQVSSSRVKVETVIPRGMHGSFMVRYDVRVPANVETFISTTNGSLRGGGLAGKFKGSIVNGSIDLDDMAGPVDVAGVNGSLSVKLAKVTGPVRLEASNGRLSLDLPASSRANLTARVVNGALHVSGLPVAEQTGNRIRNIETTLNGGGPPIDLRTTNGRITINGVGDRSPVDSPKSRVESR